MTDVCVINELFSLLGKKIMRLGLYNSWRAIFTGIVMKRIMLNNFPGNGFRKSKFLNRNFSRIFLTNFQNLFPDIKILFRSIPRQLFFSLNILANNIQ